MVEHLPSLGQGHSYRPETDAKGTLYHTSHNHHINDYSAIKGLRVYSILEGDIVGVTTTRRLDSSSYSNIELRLYTGYFACYSPVRGECPKP